MKRQSILYIGLGLSLLTAVLDYIGTILYLYWTTGWYDYMTHFLGGLTIGVLIIWALRLEARSLKSFLLVFLGVMIVGGAWEVFEYLIGAISPIQSYEVDTVHDLIMDALGAFVAFWFATTPTSISQSQES